MRLEEDLTKNEKKKLEQKLQEIAVEESKKIKYYEEELEKMQKNLAVKDITVSDSIRMLEGQLAMAKAKNHELASDLSETAMKLKDIESKLQNKDNEIKSLINSKNSFETELNSAQTRLRRLDHDHAIEMEDIRATAAIEKRQLESIRDDIESELSRMTHGIEKQVLEGVNREKRRLIAEREKDQVEFDQAVKVERETRLRVDQELHQVQVKNINQSRENKELKETLEEASERLRGYEGLLLRNKFLENELLEKAGKLGQINKTLDEFQSTLDRDQQTHNAAINKLRHQRDRAEKELEFANQEIAKLQTIVNEHSSVLQEAQGHWQSKLNEVEKKLTHQRNSQQSGKGSPSRQLEDKLTKKESELMEVQSRCKGLQNEVDGLKNDLEIRNRAVESLQLQVRSSTRDREGHDLNTDDQSKEIDELQNRFRDALTQLEFVRRSAQKLESEVDRIRKENRKLKMALAESKFADASRLDISNRGSIDVNSPQESRGMLNSTDLAVNEINNSLDKATTRIETLQRELLGCKSEYFALLRNKKEQANLIDTYRDQLSRATEETSKANIDLISIQEKTTRLELEVIRLRQLSTKLQQEHFFEVSTSERHRESESPRLSHALELKDDLLREAERNLADLNVRLDIVLADKSRLAHLNTNTSAEVTRLRRKQEEAISEIEILQKENNDLRGEYSAMKIRLLNLESKASVQALNYEELLKEKEEELGQRYKLIDQLSKDCDGLINKMKNSDTEHIFRDVYLDKSLKDNLDLNQELISSKETENLLLEEVIELRQLLTKPQAPVADSDSYASIMHACALKERQLQLKIGNLEKKCIDLEEDVREAKNLAKRESVYREEAEKFRLMYNDAQRELIKVREDMETRGITSSPYRSKLSQKTYYSPSRNQFASPAQIKTRGGDSRASPNLDTSLQSPNRSQRQLESPASIYRLRDNNSSYGN